MYNQYLLQRLTKYSESLSGRRFCGRGEDGVSAQEEVLLPGYLVGRNSPGDRHSSQHRCAARVGPWQGHLLLQVWERVAGLGQRWWAPQAQLAQRAQRVQSETGEQNQLLRRWNSLFQTSKA